MSITVKRVHDELQIFLDGGWTEARCQKSLEKITGYVIAKDVVFTVVQSVEYLA